MNRKRHHPLCHVSWARSWLKCYPHSVPVAVKHARVANRPIKEMLGGIQDYIVKKLLEKYYDNDESRVPYIDYIGAVPAAINSTLAGPEVNWLRALLRLTNVAQSRH